MFTKLLYKQDFRYLCLNYQLSIDTLKLSGELIEKYKDKVNWYYISRYQELSESFIDRDIDKVDLNYIFTHRKDLSNEFISEYKDRIDFDYIYQNYGLSDIFYRNVFF